MQNYTNYKKYYAPHHFVFLPLMGFLIVLGIVQAVNNEEKRLEWFLFSVLSFCILYLALMLRQHYALGNQNRIVRLEFRLRYYRLFGKAAEDIEPRLSFGQIAALRFADDEQFPQLLASALEKGLSAKEIKQSVTHWQADDMRV
ncbi:MAG: hypothetical protein JNL13_10890 [Chitinophagaceae bacterium]|nr:hypothetical protein [Chitinophagaceae bacterium]